MGIIVERGGFGFGGGVWVGCLGGGFFWGLGFLCGVGGCGVGWVFGVFGGGGLLGVWGGGGVGRTPRRKVKEEKIERSRRRARGEASVLKKKTYRNRCRLQAANAMRESRKKKRKDRLTWERPKASLKKQIGGSPR